ncbi:MAG TPA: hypothetical protein VI112_05760 [Bacteroidia bacterium]
MNRKILFTLLVVAAVLLFFSVDADAQCAMCKKVAEGKNASGGSVGKGLNPAILYLMSVPYFALVFIFRKQIGGYIRSKWMRKTA